jgi:hypothetical protein
VPRFPFDAAAEIIEEGSTTRTPVRVSDLSLYGCYLRISKPLPCGTHLQVIISRDYDFFEAPATVAYSQENHGNGLSFHDVKPHFLPTLQKWLAQALRDFTKANENP